MLKKEEVTPDNVKFAKEYTKISEDNLFKYKTLEEVENEEDNIIVTPINNDTIPVKTGIFKEKDYKYLVIYVLTLILLALILIKHMQNKSTKNNN